MKAAYNLQLGE